MRIRAAFLTLFIAILLAPLSCASVSAPRPPASMFETKWTALKDAIRAGNIPLALEQILTSRRTHYQEAFKQMTTTTPDLGEIHFVKNVSPIEIEYHTLVVENGFTYSYPVIFGKDTDGEWRIETF